MILGVHNSDTELIYKETSKYLGYNATSVRSIDEMSRMVKEREYDRYIIDLNLGNPGSKDITSGQTLWEIVRGRVDGKKVKFIGISNSDKVIDAAKRAGIPSTLTYNLTKEYEGFLS